MTAWDVKPIEWIDGTVRMLDQTKLPNEVSYIDCSELAPLCDAIRRLAIRGAPLLGVAAAYGMALAAHVSLARSERGVRRDLRIAAEELISTRPTAVNIAWAVREVWRSVDADDAAGGARRRTVEAARRVEDEDRRSCDDIGRFGLDLLAEGARILTHCNTGRICTCGVGTALGIVHTAHEAGRGVHVWVGETRPLLQGSRLTAWELQRAGVPMTLVTDSAASSLMARGEVDLVLVGADRICANGDVANKIGTYQLAVAARYHSVPFYVAAPASTVDLGTGSGEGIVIEQRDPSEVIAPMGVAFASAGTPVVNPAFDVTPASLITAIVTDAGVLRPPFGSALRKVVEGRRG